MHIEPGIVTGAKLALSYATAAGASAYTFKLAAETIHDKGLASLVVRSMMTTVLAFSFFEVLPHYPVGVSEVHFILGSTLVLIFGAAPAAIGLVLGLLLQGLFLAPFDLPQYGMNVTTLLVPLFAVKALAERIVPPQTAYVDLTYRQTLALSTAYQGGVVLWVAFWALYGNGLEVNNIAAISAFGAAYLMVLLIEPLADLAVLAIAKNIHQLKGSGFVTSRLHHAG